MRGLAVYSFGRPGKQAVMDDLDARFADLEIRLRSEIAQAETRLRLQIADAEAKRAEARSRLIMRAGLAAIFLMELLVAWLNKH